MDDVAPEARGWVDGPRLCVSVQLRLMRENSQETGGGKMETHDMAERRSRARERAIQMGVPVAEITPRMVYVCPSQSTPNERYYVTRTSRGWRCTCPGYHYTKMCKHLGVVENRAMREAWWFGEVEM